MILSTLERKFFIIIFVVDANEVKLCVPTLTAFVLLSNSLCPALPVQIPGNPNCVRVTLISAELVEATSGDI